MMEVIDISDIILEVLDARFINETRNFEVEKEIKQRGKLIIYVLNKADLIDKKELEKKLKLRPYAFVSCLKREGSAHLRDLIKRTVKEVDLEGKSRAQVGIIGYPNTGKSSLLNFLTGRSVAKIGNEAGFTKGMQKVRLTNNILILDTPGVIPDEEYSMKEKDKIINQATVGARSGGKIREPDLVIQRLLDEYKITLENFYHVESNGDSEIFLEKVGKKKNYLKKGGKIDVERTARQVIKEWQDGIVKG